MFSTWLFKDPSSILHLLHFSHRTTSEFKRLEYWCELWFHMLSDPGIVLLVLWIHSHGLCMLGTYNIFRRLHCLQSSFVQQPWYPEGPRAAHSQWLGTAEVWKSRSHSSKWYRSENQFTFQDTQKDQVRISPQIALMFSF